MLEICESYNLVFFEHLDLFRKALDGQDLAPDEEIKVRLVLRNSAGTFLALHELALFLPRESVRREMISFCGSLFQKEFDLKRISVLLTSVFNAFEYSLDDVMKTLSIDVFRNKIPNPNDLPFGHVMELAWVDRDNPLSWAILAHEFGHYIDETAGLSKRIANDYVNRTFKSSATASIQHFFERFCGEIVADLTAHYLLGPYSIAPVISMSLLAGLPMDRPILFDGYHPVPATRVQLLELAGNGATSMNPIQPLIAALTTEEELKEANLTPQERKQRSDIDAYIKVFFADVQPSILAELQSRGFLRFTEHNFERAADLEGQLRKGLPIGASRIVSNDELRSTFLEVDGNTTEPEIRAKYMRLQELPVNPGEVLAAGWSHKVAQMPEVIRKSFSSNSKTELFNEMKEFVEGVDSRLLKSLDVIAILERIHDSTGR